MDTTLLGAFAAMAVCMGLYLVRRRGRLAKED